MHDLLFEASPAFPDYTAIYRMGDADQSLAVFGLEYHLSNPYNSGFEILVTALTDWESKTKRNTDSRIIINEGGIRAPLPPDWSWEKILIEGGEQSFVAQYAYRHSIELVSGEPPDLADLHEAAKVLPPRTIGRYVGMRQSRQLFQRGCKPEEAGTAIEKLLQDTVATLNKRPDSAFIGYDCSYGAFAQDYAAEYGLDFSIEDWEFHCDETVSHMYGNGGTDVMVASQIVNRMRDQHFLEILRTLFEQGKSPFFATHKLHADRLAPDLLQIGHEDTSIVEQYSVATARSIGETLRPGMVGRLLCQSLRGAFVIYWWA